jgi:integrase
MDMPYTSRIDTIGPRHYRIVINLGRDPQTGKYKKKRKDVHGTRQEAEAVRDKLIAELENPQKPPSEQPLGEYLLYWIDTIARPDLEKNTYESYRWRIEKHINPSLGHIPLCALEPIHIQTFYSYKAEAGRLKGEGGLSNRSIVYLHAILKEALDKAVDLDLIPKNPCEKVKPPRDKKRKARDMVILSKQELREFLAGCKGHRDYALIFTAAYTGMRQSELLGLQWDDILWQEKAIRVKKALHRLDDGTYEHRDRTKNETSSRVIKVTDEVLAVLKEHKKRQLELQLASGGKYKNELNLVFTTPEGTPEDRTNVYHRFANLAAKLGHEGMRFHDLRHTHATILLSEGEMVNAVSERLGHADEATTLRIYAHVLPSKAEETAERFARLLRE